MAMNSNLAHSKRDTLSAKSDKAKYKKLLATITKMWKPYWQGKSIDIYMAELGEVILTTDDEELIEIINEALADKKIIQWSEASDE